MRLARTVAGTTSDEFDAQQLREARLETARRTPRWVELEAVDVVPRGRVFVAASTDEILLPYRGATFGRGTATAISDQTELYYVLDDDNQMTFYERQPGGTWSDHVRRQAERDARRARTA